MKKVNLLFMAIILLIAGISASWALPLTNKQNTFSNHSFAYTENGIVYESDPNDPSEAITKKKIDDVDQIISDHDSSKLLFLKQGSEWKSGTEAHGAFDLWSYDSLSGKSYLAYKNAKDADISSSGDLMAIAVDSPGDEIHLVKRDGTFIKKVGIHGSSPLLSSDGKMLAYYKLADYGNEQDLMMNSQGIAIYNIETGVEMLVTNSSEDFAPVAFSSDMKKLYFVSTRAQANDDSNHIASLWVVNTNGSGSPIRLTNANGLSATAYFGKNVIWSSDGRIAIDYDNDGVWMFVFASPETLTEIKRIAKGSSPRWIDQDRTIVFRENGAWHSLNISR